MAERRSVEEIRADIEGMSDEPELKREAVLHEDYSAGMVSCVFCPACAFTYDAAHTITGSYNEYACPVCAELAVSVERDELRAEVERLRTIGPRLSQNTPGVGIGRPANGLPLTDTLAERDADHPLSGGIPDRCAYCHHPRSEHHHDGACYGVCGKFIPDPEPSSVDEVKWHEWNARQMADPIHYSGIRGSVSKPRRTLPFVLTVACDDADLFCLRTVLDDGPVNAVDSVADAQRFMERLEAAFLAATGRFPDDRLRS